MSSYIFFAIIAIVVIAVFAVNAYMEKKRRDEMGSLAAGRFFNGNVRDYLTKCQTVPSNFVAAAFKFESEDYFSVEPAVRTAPVVNVSP